MAALLSRRDEAHVLRLLRSQPESAGELTAFLERLSQQVVQVALADARVAERLAGVRSRVVTADYREDKLPDSDEVPRLAEVGVYDYTHDVLVVAVVDLRTGGVVELVERAGSAPPITPEELEEAREIAAATTAGQALAGAGVRVVAFPTPSYAFQARPDALRHRGCLLYGEGPDGEVAGVVVDLTAGQVVPNEQLPEVLRSGRGGNAGGHAASPQEG